MVQFPLTATAAEIAATGDLGEAEVVVASYLVAHGQGAVTLGELLAMLEGDPHMVTNIELNAFYAEKADRREAIEANRSRTWQAGDRTWVAADGGWLEAELVRREETTMHGGGRLVVWIVRPHLWAEGNELRVTENNLTPSRWVVYHRAPDAAADQPWMVQFDGTVFRSYAFVEEVLDAQNLVRGNGCHHSIFPLAPNVPPSAAIEADEGLNILYRHNGRHWIDASVAEEAARE